MLKNSILPLNFLILALRGGLVHKSNEGIKNREGFSKENTLSV